MHIAPGIKFFSQKFTSCENLSYVTTLIASVTTWLAMYMYLRTFVNKELDQVELLHSLACVRNRMDRIKITTFLRNLYMLHEKLLRI